MKQLITGVLCCLLLCGCSPALPETPAAPEATAATASCGPGSALEQQYHGAVLSYPLDRSDALGLLAFGDGLLLFSGEETTTLTLLSGEDLLPAAAIELDFIFSPEDPSLVLREQTLSFYDPEHKETVVLDTRLEMIRRISAPEGLSGSPLLSRDQMRLYYCTETALMVWDLESGLHRTLKEMAYPAQSVAGLHRKDTVVQCRTGETNLFLSAETGTLIRQWEGPLTLISEEETFLAAFHLGLTPVLTWDLGKGCQLLLPEGADGNYLLLNNHPGAVRIVTHPSGSVQAEYYALNTGCRGSVLSLTAKQTPCAAAYSQNFLYLLCCDPSSPANTILRWDLAALATNDSTSYAADYATEALPLTDAMNRCEAYAEELSQRFGLQIRIGSDGAAVQPWDYDLEAELQPAILMRELKLLETRLARFPEGMLSATASDFSSLSLCLVRSVTGSAESGSLNHATGVQFLEGSDAYVVITTGRYSRQALYHELFHAMETHIFNYSIAFDQWDALNPAGFRYAYGHAANESRDSGIYLQPEYRSFVDVYSMSFPKEDRARIFEYAMLEGYKALFEAPVLQAKLAAVCEGIREAYHLEDFPEPLPWEQYRK